MYQMTSTATAKIISLPRKSAVPEGGFSASGAASSGADVIFFGNRTGSSVKPPNEGADLTTDYGEIAAHLVTAMRDWGLNSGSGATPGPHRTREELERALPGLLHEMNSSFELNREVRDPDVRRALQDLRGDASLRQLAAMTPQEVLDLPGCGPASLERVLAELRALRVLTFPEIVSGAGKVPTPLRELDRDAGRMARDLVRLMGLGPQARPMRKGQVRAQMFTEPSRCDADDAKICKLLG